MSEQLHITPDSIRTSRFLDDIAIAMGVASRGELSKLLGDEIVTAQKQLGRKPTLEDGLPRNSEAIRFIQTAQVSEPYRQKAFGMLQAVSEKSQKQE